MVVNFAYAATFPTPASFMLAGTATDMSAPQAPRNFNKRMAFILNVPRSTVRRFTEGRAPFDFIELKGEICQARGTPRCCRRPGHHDLLLLSLGLRRQDAFRLELRLWLLQQRLAAVGRRSEEFENLRMESRMMQALTGLTHHQCGEPMTFNHGM